MIIFYTFEECEPVKLKFQVDIFNKASGFDRNPEEDTKEYIEYCKESGWIHIVSKGKFQLFYNEDLNAVPIQTDENIKFKYLRSAMLKGNIAYLMLPIISLIIYIMMYLVRLSWSESYTVFADYITEYTGMPLGLLFLAILILAIVSFLRFLIFNNVNKKRLKKGLNIKYYSYKNAKGFMIFNTIAGILMFIYIITAMLYSNDIPTGAVAIICVYVILLFVLIQKIIYRKKSNRKSNIILPMVVVIAIHTVLLAAIFIYIFYFMDFDSYIDSYDVITQKSFWGTETTYDRDGYLDEDVYCSITSFSSDFSLILNKYDEIVADYYDASLIDMSEYDDELDITEAYYTDEFYDEDYISFETIYIVNVNNITYVINGELNQDQVVQVILSSND